MLEQAGGSVERARDTLKEASRAEWRSRQRAAAPFSIETPEEARERVERQTEAERQRHLAASGIPQKYAEASLDDFSHLPADCRDDYADTAQTLKNAASQPGVIIGLCGIRGPGKTYMACAVVRAYCRALRPARYVVAADYLSAIMAEYKPGGNVDLVERRFREPQLLVIDEIQVRPDTAAQANRLTSLVDYRYRENRTTIIVGNLDEKGLIACVGDSIADRIHDGGGVLSCTWPSLRGRIARAA